MIHKFALNATLLKMKAGNLHAVKNAPQTAHTDGLVQNVCLFLITALANTKYVKNVLTSVSIVTFMAVVLVSKQKKKKSKFENAFYAKKLLALRVDHFSMILRNMDGSALSAVTLPLLVGCVESMLHLVLGLGHIAIIVILGIAESIVISVLLNVVIAT